MYRSVHTWWTSTSRHRPLMSCQNTLLCIYKRWYIHRPATSHTVNTQQCLSKTCVKIWFFIHFTLSARILNNVNNILCYTYLRCIVYTVADPRIIQGGMIFFFFFVLNVIVCLFYSIQNKMCNNLLILLWGRTFFTNYPGNFYTLSVFRHYL